jgi:hypothetical protein
LLLLVGFSCNSAVAGAEINPALAEYIKNLVDNEIEITAVENLSYFDNSKTTVDYEKYEKFDFSKPSGENDIVTFSINNYDRGLLQMYRVKGQKHSRGGMSRRLNGSYERTPDSLFEYTFNVTDKRTFDTYQNRLRSRRYIEKSDLEKLFRSFEYTAIIKSLENNKVIDETVYSSNNYREQRAYKNADAALLIYENDRPVYLHNFKTIRDWVADQSWNDPFLVVETDDAGLYEAKIKSKWYASKSGVEDSMGNYTEEYEYIFNDGEYQFSWGLIKDIGPYSGSSEKGVFSYTENEITLKASEVDNNNGGEWVKVAGTAANTKRIKYSYKDGILTIGDTLYSKE